MYCNQCGNEIKEGEGFCPKCGNSINQEQQVNNENQGNFSNEHKDGVIGSYIKDNNITSPMALIGFICSILGLLVLPYIFGAVSVVLGILALQQKNIDKRGKNQAITAVVLGVVDIIAAAYIQGFIIGLLR